jgi:hypothetical protein
MDGLVWLMVFNATFNNISVIFWQSALLVKKSSSQKPPSQLNCDFAGMIIGWSCTKLVNRLPIGIQDGRHDST